MNPHLLILLALPLRIIIIRKRQSIGVLRASTLSRFGYPHGHWPTSLSRPPSPVILNIAPLPHQTRSIHPASDFRPSEPLPSSPPFHLIVLGLRLSYVTQYCTNSIRQSGKSKRTIPAIYSCRSSRQSISPILATPDQEAGLTATRSSSAVIICRTM